MIAEYKGLQFPRNRMPLLGRSLLHGHFLPIGRIGKSENIFFIVRDGRDVMVSMYFHFLIWNERNRMHPKDVNYFRKHLPFEDYKDISSNLPDFIRFVFTNKPSRLTRFLHEGDWRSYNDKWLKYMEEDKGAIIKTSYENLLTNTETELKKVLIASGEGDPDEKRISDIVKKFSFSRQSGRERGKEDQGSFLRKGVAGDWKNKFTREAGEVFNSYAGDMLVRLGYEDDSSWVKNL